MKMAGPHIFVSNFWGLGLAPSPVSSIYFNWYIFALSLFLYAILPFTVNFTVTMLLNRSRHLHVSRVAYILVHSLAFLGAKVLLHCRPNSLGPDYSRPRVRMSRV